MSIKRHMAALLYYAGGSAAAYWLGSNIILRSANVTIDWVLNANASPTIKETHTVKSILSMLRTYGNMRNDHPAFQSLCDVRAGLKDLQTCIERAKLRSESYKTGYITRFRTFDATADNIIIEECAANLMHRLELFTQLMKLPT
jgi:hypothetical protein